MALQDEVISINAPHWVSEDTQNAPKNWSSLTGNGDDSPTRDSVTSDETTSASAVDVQMILDQDEYMGGEPMSPRPTLHSPLIARANSHLPGTLFTPETQKPEPEQSEPLEGTPTVVMPLSGPSNMLTPTASRLLASTPRRSPRLSPIPYPANHSTSSQHPMQAPSDFIATIPSIHSATHSSTSVQHTPIVSSMNQTSYFPAFPSPSLSQSASVPIWPEQHVSEAQSGQIEASSSTNLREETVGAVSQEAASVSQAAVEFNGQQGDQRMDDASLRDTHMSEAEQAHPSLTTLISPEAPLEPEESTRLLAFPTTSNAASNPDLSSIFASPIPNMTQPVLSPLRLHQGFQTFALQSLSLPPNSDPSSFTTPQRSSDRADASIHANGNPRLSSLSPTQTSLLDSLTNPLAMVEAGQDLQTNVPSAPKKPNSIISRSNITNGGPANAGSTRGFMTPPSKVIIMEQMKGASRAAMSTTPKKTLPAFSGSLVPPTTPNNLHPPFPVTPQQSNGMARSFSAPSFISPTKQPDSSSVPGDNTPQPVASKSTIPSTHTPSRIPIPHPTSATLETASTQGSNALDGFGVSSMTVTSPSSSIQSPGNLLSPTIMSSGSSQLRQPSSLRAISSGGASKIPRPGKKPYSKPVSRLPKLPNKVTSVFPPAVPPKIPQPPPVQVSPMKTRRGRLNAQNTLKIAPFITELPPDAIIYKPPPPKIRPVPEVPSIPITEDVDIGTPEADEGLVSGRASPPTESGMSPPKSGLLLKSRAKRLKEEMASESVAPEFSATAPSLGIFPSLTRANPKGRGRNTAQRPMLMPLDATSLKRITTSNTLRNQEYVCSKVDVKVVLKEGKRPASPTTKVRTVLEKKKEQEKNDRKQRAAARATGRLGTPGDEEMHDGDAGKRKHPRGAGDEEDYKTPVKTRQDRGDMDVDLDELMDKEPKKRVKWNKDLLERFEPDEASLEALKSRAEIARTRAASKSCISVQVLLDPLGNVPEADAPIANLKKEEVTVTRLVYIDELPPSERPKRAAATKANSRITPI